MKAALVALSLFAVLALVNAQANDFITAFPQRYSWEVISFLITFDFFFFYSLQMFYLINTHIFSNNTSYLDQIDAHRGVIFVAGEGYVREIVEEPVFELSYHHSYFRQTWQRYLDFKVFVHNNVSYVFGPITTSMNGHALRIATLDDDDHFYLPGNVQIASVAATDMDDHVVVYGAGWYVNNTDPLNMRVDFAVYRFSMHPNHTQYHNGSFISFNQTTDVVILPDFAGYTEYTREFKPWIFHSTTAQQLIVVDPATDRVYRYRAPNMRNETFHFLSASETAFSSTNITSAVFDESRGILVIGTKGRGSYPGTVVAIDMFDPPYPRPNVPLKVLFTKTLDTWESNPKALGIRGSSLFVGLNGGSYILHLNLTNSGQLVSYSTLPFFARNIHDIHVGREHLYVVTNEQFSKIARTQYAHFCATPCDPLYGFCNNGTCACHPGHVINNTRVIGHCSPDFTTETQEVENVTNVSYHAGEIVMGLLFALCFVAAALGWFSIWRIHSGKPGLFGIGGGSSRYSAVHHEERENFLGSDN